MMLPPIKDIDNPVKLPSLCRNSCHLENHLFDYQRFSSESLKPSQFSKAFQNETHSHRFKAIKSNGITNLPKPWKHFIHQFGARSDNENHYRLKTFKRFAHWEVGCIFLRCTLQNPSIAFADKWLLYCTRDRTPTTDVSFVPMCRNPAMWLGINGFGLIR